MSKLDYQEYKQYTKEINEKYKKFMELINANDIKKLGKEFDLDNQYSAWVNDYLGGTPCEKADELYSQLIESDSLQLVIKDAENIFKKIYVIVPNNRDDQTDDNNIFEDNNISKDPLEDNLDKNCNIIATFMPNIFKEELTIDDTFSVNTFLQTQEEMDEEPKEYIDPLHFLDTQKEIDEYTEKVKNNEITIVEMLSHFGYDFADVDNDKVKDIIDKIVNNEISDDEIKNKVSNNEISPTEILVIDTQLKLAYPDVYKKLNENN